MGGLGKIYQERGLLRRLLPALAFLTGFVWDSVTMGRMVSMYDLLVLAAYYFGAGLVLVFLVREVSPRLRNRLVFLIQFFFGGLFSALVVFYFRSAGSFYTFIAVAGLVFLLIYNEFSGGKKRSHTLNWTLLTICGTMYLNFLIPHIAGSVKPVWFYLSCTISLSAVLALFLFSGAAGRETEKYPGRLKKMVPAAVVVAVLAVLYQSKLIPPVPLVLKDSHIGRYLAKDNNVYQIETGQSSLLYRLGLDEPVAYYRDGEKIYYLVSVFAPTMVAVDLEHRWWYQDGQGDWLLQNTIPLSMVGGRKRGWRTYSYIENTLRPGHWKVETALKGGAVLSVHRFSAQRIDGEAPWKIRTVKVD